VCVWALPEGPQGAVTVALQAVWQSSMLTGACFAGDDVVVVPYDHEEAAVYSAA